MQLFVWLASAPWAIPQPMAGPHDAANVARPLDAIGTCGNG